MKDHMQDELNTEYFVLRDEDAGLDGVIALHSAALGAGAGGCRFWHYPSRGEMTMDAARLARGMTYKNALAELPLGGRPCCACQGARSTERSCFAPSVGRLRSCGGATSLRRM